MIDWFARAFGEVVADVRENVVEKPWFGRDIAPDPGPFTAPPNDVPSSDHLRNLHDWLHQPDDVGIDRSAPGPAPEPSPSHDIDR